jgi:hypothetical protein
MPAGVSAYVPLANITLGVAANTVTFSSIPATYRDLIIIGTYTLSTAQYVRIRFNGDATTTNYYDVDMLGNGTTFSSTRGNDNIINPSVLGQATGSVKIEIMDYSATDKHKTGLSRLNESTTGVGFGAFRWANTAAVTSVALVGNGVNFNSASNFALYGIPS